MNNTLVLDSNINSMNILLAGVGGQGTILASNLLADLGLKLGLDVKKAEVHGMSQRGGSVTSHLRYGKQVFSPLITRGEADILLAFEEAEAVRFVDFLRPDGLLVINRTQIYPVTVSSGNAKYPSVEEIDQTLKKYTQQVYYVDGESIAQEIGNSKAANVVLLGALCTLLKGDPQVWKELIKSRVPARLVDINFKAFEAGERVIG